MNLSLTAFIIYWALNLFMKFLRIFSHHLLYQLFIHFLELLLLYFILFHFLIKQSDLVSKLFQVLALLQDNLDQLTLIKGLVVLRLRL